MPAAQRRLRALGPALRRGLPILHGVEPLQRIEDAVDGDEVSAVELPERRVIGTARASDAHEASSARFSATLMAGSLTTCCGLAHSRQSSLGTLDHQFCVLSDVVISISPRENAPPGTQTREAA